jgi:hypothetical protein
MGTSSSAPPDDGDLPESEDDDDLELTSVMNVEQQRALRKAARKAAEVEMAADPERPTARPLPAAGVVADVAIPKAPPVPAATEIDPPAEAPAEDPPAAPVEEQPAAGGRSITTIAWVAFVVLLAAVAYALRQ